MRKVHPLPLPLLLAVVLAACSNNTGTTDVPGSDLPGTDAVSDAPVDTGPADVQPASTAHCMFEQNPPLGHSTGVVTEGALQAGAAEAPLDLPVGSALGAYTARASFSGSAGRVDDRQVEYSGQFQPSVGVETVPRVRALALTAGGETVVILKADLGAADDNITTQVARALGPEFAGKVLFATSHSHSGFGHFSSNVGLGVGFGRLRNASHQRTIDALVAVSRRALEARVPARLGIAHNGAFDPMDTVSHDRRGENDDLPGGMHRKDHDLFVIRVDAMDGAPIAVLPVFGVHGTVMDADNNLASGDAPGAIERAVEESFDRAVVVMHLQGAAGDVSPAGSGGIDCGDAASPCYDGRAYNFARAETVGRAALPFVRAAWTQAGTAMRDTLAIEMVTRQIPLGTDWRTFTVRDGALSYAPFVPRRQPDGLIFADGGAVRSPIDEFNAPLGAALCGGEGTALPPAAQMPGTAQLLPYRSCSTVGAAAMLLGLLVDLPLTRDEVVCASTRTTVSALRLGDYVIGALPGEPLTLLADRTRALSPAPPERTIVVGYAQGHAGYLLTADDWLRGGYEPSINFWGPLEGEYIAEQTASLLRAAMTPEREDTLSTGATHYVVEPDTQAVPPADATPAAGTVPSAVPTQVYARNHATLASAQPAAQVPRLTSAYFVWIGEDPVRATPRVTLQREHSAGAGDFADVVRHSGRPVNDGDLLLTWTPQPFRREGTSPRTHYWAVEWQAVRPVGDGAEDALEDRTGLPLGRYRFHVDGTGYQLNSNAFEVTAGALSVTARRTGNNIELDLGYLNPTGWRLLDLSVASNQRVPLRRGSVTVELTLADGSTRAIPLVPLGTTAGHATVDAGADAANVRSVRVSDRFGNSGTGGL